MSKRKYKTGPRIKKLDDILQYDYIEMHFMDGHIKNMNNGWVLSWQIRTAQKLIDKGMLFGAIPIETEEEKVNESRS